MVNREPEHNRPYIVLLMVIVVDQWLSITGYCGCVDFSDSDLKANPTFLYNLINLHLNSKLFHYKLHTTPGLQPA